MFVSVRDQASRCVFGRCKAIIGLALLGLALVPTGSAFAVTKSWNAGNGSWYTDGNWTPVGVPSGNEDIRIGNLPGVQNSTVVLSAPGSGYGSLEISSGMTLDINGGELVSFGDALIKDANSRLIVRPALGPNMADFQGVLNVGVGAYFEMRDNAPVRLFGDSQSAGTISGRGEIEVSSFLPFRNSGVIDPEGNGGIVLTQGSGALQPIDLDGSNGQGQLLLSTPFSELEVNASSLTDPFSSDIFMGVGALLTMNITDGWVAQTSSTINVGGSNIPAAASQIAGSHMTFAGTINVGGAEGHLRVLAPATYLANSNVNVGITDWLDMDGATIVQGGQFTLGQGAQLDFDGPVTIRGGVFETFSDLNVGGSVDFNGATIWDGNVIVNGIARQVGDATVAGATTIDAGVLDMDGNGATSWQVDHNLVVNADHIDSTLSNTFDGTINVGSGFLPRLTISLTDPNAQWTHAGEMNLSGVLGALFFTNRLAGSAMRLTGDLNVNRLAGISADATFAADSTLSFESAESALRVDGTTRFEAGAVVTGLGTLRNGPAGDLTLDSGATLGEAGLVNGGRLEIGDSPGIAAVDRFQNLASGNWLVELGGTTAGSEFDLLVVGGGAAVLDGLLEVSLIDTGAGVFLPEIGDEFAILTALGGVTGAFLNSPVSMAGGQTYHWAIDYNPNDVTLRLVSISVPEPGGMLLLVGLWAAATVSRSWTSRRR